MKTEPPGPWVPEGPLASEAGRDSLEPLGLEAMMVLEEAMDNLARPVPPERQASPDPPVLRAKSDPQALPAPTAPLDREENLDLRDTLVLQARRALLGATGAPVAKAKWVPLAFLGLPACPEPGAPQARPGPMVLQASEVLPVNPARTGTRETLDPAGSAAKRVPPASRARREKTARTVRQESRVPTGSREPPERGARPDSEDPPDPMASPEKRVPPESVGVQAPRGLEEPPEKPAETAPPEAPE